VTDFGGMKVAVIGAARTGTAVARALVPRGARVHVYDAKPEGAMTEARDALLQVGATFTFGASEGPELEKADIVVPSPGVPKTSVVLQRAVQRGQTVWSEPEVAYRLTEARFVAITGTNGKTTTTALIGEVLRSAGLDARVGGNIAPGTPLITLAAEAPASAVLVAEISSFQLEWTASFRPAVGVITNITEDHLDRHGTVAEYAAMKARLFAFQTPGDAAVVNADSPPALEAARSSKGSLWTFSRLHEVERGAFLRGSAIVLRDAGQDRDVMDAGEILIPGRHNLENSLAAVVACHVLGASPEAAKHTLTRFRGVEHRMEVVGEAGGVRYINNSMCTNPAALIGSLEALDCPVVAIVGGREKGLDFSAVPDVLKRRCRAVISIGAFGPQMAEMARRAGVETVIEAGTLAAAVPLAAEAARPGDVVMLAPGCASHDQFSGFEERGRLFRELALARISGAT
jgi:UDP-N-acetylmuramoylalanine--D-glutamate ligase